MKKSIKPIHKILCTALMLVMLMALLPGAAFAAKLPFTDVPSNQWYASYVAIAVEDGLVNGKTPTTYCPNDNLTYVEAIKLAACMHQKSSTGSVSLQNGSPWYKPYVDYAKLNGIITKDYPLMSNATRAGYMEIFANALPDSALGAMNNVPDGSIPDVPMSHGQAAAIYKLYRAGVLQGVDTEHRCTPSSYIMRSEVATILVRMMHREERISFSMGPGLTIVTQPADFSVQVGGTVSLSVAVTGGQTPYSYQWQSAYGDSDIFHDMTGNASARTSNLKVVITETDLYNKVKYRCVVTDASNNSVVSNAASGTQLSYNTLSSSDFLFYVRDVFTVKSRGIVLTGVIENGKIKTGDTVKLVMTSSSGMPEVRSVTVTAIEMFKKIVDWAEKGDSVGICIGFPFGVSPDGTVHKGNLKIGDILLNVDTPLQWKTGDYVGTFQMRTKEEGGSSVPLYDYDTVSLSYIPNYTNVSGSIIPGGSISPGETRSNVVLRGLSRHCVLYVGQKILVYQSGRFLGYFTIDKVL